MFKLLVASFFILSYALAGNGSHGGDGILINRKPYLLDLVEFNAHLKGPTITGSCAIRDLDGLLTDSIEEVNEEIRIELISRINDLCKISPSIAVGILMGINTLVFNWVDLSLRDIKDEETPLGYDSKMIVQLAARQDFKVFIDSNLWQQLDLRNKVALILHETVFALLKPEMISGGFFRQKSPHARSIVGSLYSGKLGASAILTKKILDTLAIPDIKTGAIDEYSKERIGVIELEASVFYEHMDSHNKNLLWFTKLFNIKNRLDIQSSISEVALTYCKGLDNTIRPILVNDPDTKHVSSTILFKFSTLEPSILDYQHGPTDKRSRVVIDFNDKSIIKSFLNEQGVATFDSCIKQLTDISLSVLGSLPNL